MWTFRCLCGAILVCSVVHPSESTGNRTDPLFAVTKLLLGASVGLPCALVCAAWQLENLASSRDISSDSRVQGRRKLIEMAICYIPPLIFISLRMSLCWSTAVHPTNEPILDIIVQDHRFDLVKDLGCSASIHPSTPALVIVWLPPLITCFIAFVICGKFLCIAIGPL